MGVLECPFCPRTFYSANPLADHMVDSHDYQYGESYMIARLIDKNLDLENEIQDLKDKITYLEDRVSDLEEGIK